MSDSLGALANMEYPGRFIILGYDPSGEQMVAVYGITGRSPSSRARKLEFEGNAIWTKPIDEETLKKGNPELLIYPALIFTAGIAVSNGRQTADVKKHMEGAKKPALVLDRAMSEWDYEPDAPIFTPRISGCVLPDLRAALGIIRRTDDGSSKKIVYEVPPLAGRGKLIATYSGENKDPVPSFRNEPLDLEITEKTPQDMAEAIFAALEPQRGRQDFRVAVACVYSPDFKKDAPRFFILNRSERS